MDNKNVKITLIKNGPLKVEGELKIVDEEEKLVKEGNKFFLCRCGASNNKPFCDGTHKKIEFES